MTARQKHATPHSHSFGQERRRPGEARTIIVIAITAAMMLVEIHNDGPVTIILDSDDLV